MIILEVLTFHGGNKQIPLAWPDTLTEGLGVEIYLYVLPLSYLDTWDRKLPTSSDTQIGWDLPKDSTRYWRDFANLGPSDDLSLVPRLTPPGKHTR